MSGDLGLQLLIPIIKYLDSCFKIKYLSEESTTSGMGNYTAMQFSNYYLPHQSYTLLDL